jgi:hypothetical protein
MYASRAGPRRRRGGHAGDRPAVADRPAGRARLGRAGPRPDSVATARRRVRAFAVSNQLPEDVADALCLVASELVTNSVLHASTALLLTMEARPGVVRISARDRFPAALAVPHYPLEALTGRGLGVVAALSRRGGRRGRARLRGAAGRGRWLLPRGRPADPAAPPAGHRAAALVRRAVRRPAAGGPATRAAVTLTAIRASRSEPPVATGGPAGSHRSTPWSSTGFTSTMGVPSSASKFRTRMRVPSIETIVTRVQPDRVRAIGRAGAEDALCRPGRIAARMNHQHVAARTVEPGQHDDIGTGLKVAKTLAHALLEHQPSVGRAFVALLRRHVTVDQGGLDPPDRPYGIRTLAQGSRPVRSTIRLAMLMMWAVTPREISDAPSRIPAWVS